MRELAVERLTPAYFDALFAFETENRSYFESIGIGRSDAYYVPASYREIMQEQQALQERGLVMRYVIMDGRGRVMGRLNLSDIMLDPLRKAELGYRVGKEHQGKGVATAAVGHVLRDAARGLGLHRVEAGTAPDNIGSQIVLIKNGFQFCGRYSRYMLRDGGWVDGLIFEKLLD